MNETNSPALGKSHKANVTEQIALLGLVQGFLPASVLFALQRLRIFELIGERERTATELAYEIGSEADNLTRLLNAGVVLGLLETPTHDRYAIPANYQKLLLPSDEPGFIGNWIDFMQNWYVQFADLDRAVLNGGSTNMYSHDQAIIRQNTLAMHNFASLRGRELIDHVDASSYRSMLDVCCGPGTYSFEFGLKYPHLVLNLLDLAPVLDVTQEVGSRYTIGNEIHYQPTDLDSEPIAGTYDLILVSNALQAFNQNKIESLLAQVYEATNPGGSVIIQAQFLAEDRLGPRWPVFVDLGCLFFTPGGANHSTADAKRWLTEAGFVEVQEHRMSRFNANSYVRGTRR